MKDPQTYWLLYGWNHFCGTGRDRTPTPSFWWHGLCTQVYLTITTGREQILGESQETPGRRGLLDLCKGIPRENYWHGGGNSIPPRAQYMGFSYPCGHTGKAMPYGLEVTRALGRDAPLHAPCGARGGNTPLPYKTWSIPRGRGGVPGLAVSGI